MAFSVENHNSHVYLTPNEGVPLEFCNGIELNKPVSCPYQMVGWPKFNQLEVVTTCTDKPSLVRIDARNLELSW